MRLRPRPLLLALIASLTAGVAGANAIGGWYGTPYLPIPDNYHLNWLWLIIPTILVEYFFLRMVLRPERPHVLLIVVIGVHLVSYPITVVLASALVWLSGTPLLAQIAIWIAETVTVVIEYFLYKEVARRFVKPEELGRRWKRGRFLFGMVFTANLLSYLAGVAFQIHMLRQAPPGTFGRSVVSRAKADMRSLATGIESYMVDWGTYQFQYRNLTTPICYFTEIPTDPFSPYSHERAGEPFRYLATQSSWLVWSAGPDHDYDLTAENVPQLLDRIGTGTLSQTHPLLLPFTWDPTNGAVSNGDIWRIRQ